MSNIRLSFLCCFLFMGQSLYCASGLSNSMLLDVDAEACGRLGADSQQDSIVLFVDSQISNSMVLDVETEANGKFLHAQSPSVFSGSSFNSLRDGLTPTGRTIYALESEGGRMHRFYSILRLLYDIKKTDDADTLKDCCDLIFQSILEIDCGFNCLEQGESVNVLNKQLFIPVLGFECCTLLHLAIFFLQDVSLIERLIILGANINVICHMRVDRGYKYFTSLDLALFMNNRDVVCLLHDKSANFNEENIGKLTLMLRVKKEDRKGDRPPKKNHCSIT